MILLQKLLIYSGSVVETLKVCFSGELNKVVISSLIFSQQSEVVVIFVAGVTTETTVGSDINLATNDRLYAYLPGCQVELDGTIHNPVVGYCQTVHTQLLGSVNQLRNAAHAIKQAILGMDMEMSEHGTFQWAKFAIIIAQDLCLGVCFCILGSTSISVKLWHQSQG